jgi:hypothetical protein
VTVEEAVVGYLKVLSVYSSRVTEKYREECVSYFNW